jgi:D-alanyl-D-alanine dipeptidase
MSLAEVVLLLALPAAAPAAPPPLAAAPAEADDLVDVTRLEPRLVLDIRYATTDNFTGQKLYPVARCLLRASVAAQLVAAQRWLDGHHPGAVLVLKDCYRPAHIQQRMWDAVRGTKKALYVASPDKKIGSVHNYGAAVDVTLAEGGRELDLGTPYDYFGTLAELRHEERYLALGKLSAAQLDRRHLLRAAMVEGGGFKTIISEWWHFDALQGVELARRYHKLDVPLEAVP